MPDGVAHTQFPRLNRAYNRAFQPERLSLGLVVPLEAYPNSPAPTMDRHIERAELADRLGFAALWLRDVPFNVPSFGDTGQMFDPFVYLGVLSAVTQNIGLGVASIILPLRHPAHVAKAATSADQLSGGRVLLGVASGDRPEEYPALNMSFQDRGNRFRESLSYIRSVAGDYPEHSSAYGSMAGNIDMLPKPVAERLPVLITGGSQQSPEWVATHGDGWMTYPRDVMAQSRVVKDYRDLSTASDVGVKPVMQSLYIDLVDDPDAAPSPIHLGFRSGMKFLRSYLRQLEDLGINHVALNLRFNGAGTEDTMNRLADDLLPDFPTRGLTA
ncbi:MAG: LLM class oxidoreductase [Pseudomonadota bacterium]